MAVNYVTVTENDFSRGIDQRSSENLLAQGFSEDILNMDIVEKRVRKRKGHQEYAGHLPVRVKSINYNTDSTNNITFTLDGSIDMSRYRSTPLLVYGRTSETGNPSELGKFGYSDVMQYYPSFSADFRKVLDDAFTTLSLTADDHATGSNLLFVGVAESTAPANLSNSVILPSEIAIDISTADVDIDYVVAADTPAFVYYSDKTPVAGDTFAGVDSGNGGAGGTIVCPSSLTPTSFTIDTATHSLDNYIIVPKVYQDTGSEYIEILPERLELDPVSGDVTIDILNTSGSPIYVFAILSTAPVLNTATLTVPKMGSETRSIPTPGGTFPFLAVYQDVAGKLELVVPDDISYNSSTDILSVSVTNSSPTPVNYQIYYEFGTIVSNQITVTDTSTIGSAFVDSSPQLTLWGLDHADLYGNNRVAREGWVNHVDGYRRSLEERLVAGLGGNIYAARTRAEVGTTYAMPILYPNLRARADTAQVLAPAFWSKNDTGVGRTRGYLRATGGGDNLLEVLTASWRDDDTHGNVIDYVISTPDRTIVESNGTTTAALTDIISTVTGLEDYLTVDQMGHSTLNGTYRIVNVALTSSTTITITVITDELDSSDYDEVDAGGTAGIFTDQFESTDVSPFTLDDRIYSEVLGDTDLVTVRSAVGTTTVLSGVTSISSFPSALRIRGERTSPIIPMRDDVGIPNVDNVVVGDMLSVTGVARQLRVKSVNVNSDLTIADITGNGAVATLTLGTGDTTSWAEGQQLQLANAGNYTGTVTISEILSTTEFTFESTLTESSSIGVVIGYSVEVDENYTFSDIIDNTVAFTVGTRWIPIEAPDDEFDSTPSTYVKHFDVNGYTDQDLLRSTMVNDSMYFTAGNDEVMKFDGNSVYRAGLPRWQPALFTAIDTAESTGSGEIALGHKFVTFTARDPDKFTIDSASEFTLNIGDTIEDGESKKKYIITNIKDDGESSPVSAFIYVDRPIIGATTSSTLTQVSTFRYFFRITAIDANDNIVAAAATGDTDFIVELAEDAAITIRLVGFPAWHNYDYDRMEVEIYRTRANPATTAPAFYRVTTLPLSFNEDEGYFQYRDTTSDDTLTDDPVDVSILGAEIGRTFTEPLRAKYITSASNKLVLGNIKDYPQLDIRMLGSNVLNADLFGTTWTFRKDSTDDTAPGDTDMTSVVRYEWVDLSSGTAISGINTLDTGTAGQDFTVYTGTTPATLANGDWIYLYYSAADYGNDLTYTGWFQVTSFVADTSITLNYGYAAADAAVTYPDRFIAATDPTDIPVGLGIDGNINTLFGNTSSDSRLPAMNRLGSAINASMRQAVTEPWLLATYGGEFQGGQLIVRQPRSDGVSPELVIHSTIPASVSDIFVNNIKRSAGDQIAATERLFPSRVLLSFPSFPEIFDAPTSTFAGDSLSAVDINSADGQEITGLLPFFGDSTSQDSQKESVIIIFKTNSVYLLNSNTRAVSRLETRGLGCTAPGSIAVTKDGVIFANDTGIYRIDRQFQLRYVGRYMERRWLESVNRDQIEIMQGTHYALGHQYKLSVPVGSDSTENSEVFVYDHSSETDDTGSGQGSWTRYDSHAATGWANLSEDAYFATTTGRVYGLRRAGDTTDYRDDDRAINASITYRSMDFSNSGIRKAVANVVSYYRSNLQATGTTLEFAEDMSEVFRSTEGFRVTRDTDLTNLSDEGQRKVQTIRHSFSRRKVSHLQLRWSNATIDEPLELAGFAVKVGALNRKGIQEAADTNE